MKALATIGLATLFIVGCVAGEEGPAEPPQGENGFSSTAKGECLAQSGSYERRGMMGQYSCALPYADAGKVCTRPSDCEGQCRVESDTSTTGKCQATTDPFGCYTYIDEEGRVVGLCVD